MVTPFLSGVFNYYNDNIYFASLENLAKEYVKNISLSINTRWRKDIIGIVNERVCYFFY